MGNEFTDRQTKTLNFSYLKLFHSYVDSSASDDGLPCAFRNLFNFNTGKNIRKNVQKSARSPAQQQKCALTRGSFAFSKCRKNPCQSNARRKHQSCNQSVDRSKQLKLLDEYGKNDSSRNACG